MLGQTKALSFTNWEPSNSIWLLYSVSTMELIWLESKREGHLPLARPPGLSVTLRMPELLLVGRQPHCGMIISVIIYWQQIDAKAFLLLTPADLVKVMKMKLGPALKISNSILMFRNSQDVTEDGGASGQETRRQTCSRTATHTVSKGLVPLEASLAAIQLTLMSPWPYSYFIGTL